MTTLTLVRMFEFQFQLIVLRPMFFVVGSPAHVTWWKKADLHHDGGNM